MKTRAQTRFFLSSRTSANSPRVSSCSFSQFSSFKASWFFLIKSSLSHGFSALASVARWRDLSSLNRSIFWLICRRTRSLYCSHAEKTNNQKDQLLLFTVIDQSAHLVPASRAEKLQTLEFMCGLFSHGMVSYLSVEPDMQNVLPAAELRRW